MTKYNYKTQPYEHQRQALIQGACQNNYAYFMEMGTGKTKVSIDNVAYLHQQNKIDAAKQLKILLLLTNRECVPLLMKQRQLRTDKPNAQKE
jgi:superfamily I DNA/RNA helicase